MSWLDFAQYAATSTAISRQREEHAKKVARCVYQDIEKGSGSSTQAFLA
jgi:hypothetical protein